MNMQIINQDPIRYILEKTVKKGLFVKKEVTKCAIGDENGQALTEYDWEVIEPYEDGVCMVQKHPRSNKLLIDLMGQQILKNYTGYQVRPKNGYYFLSLIHNSLTVEQIMEMSWFDSFEKGKKTLPYLARGIANKSQKILIDPKKNMYLEVHGNLVLYGNSSTVGMDYNRLGIGRLDDGEFIPLIPTEYNYVEVLNEDYVVAGRVIVTKTTQAATLTTNRISVTNRAAVQIFYAKTGSPVSDTIYGNVHINRDGTISATMYPNILPADLLHRQSAGEAFNGNGLLDFSGEKNVRLDSNFRKM